MSLPSWPGQGTPPFFQGSYFANIYGPSFTDLGYTSYFYGSAETNSFVGDAGYDVMYGFGGTDILRGNGATDVLYGGDDDGVGNIDINWLYGGSSSDGLYGGNGALDRLYGGNGNDVMYGFSGADRFVSGEGNDSQFGGDGQDYFQGDQGNDSIVGGSGVDTIQYTDSVTSIQIDLAAGTASGGHAEGDQISQIENLHGTDYDDVLLGDGNANSLFGSNGNDVIDGRGGNDIILGGGNAKGSVIGDDLTGGSGDDEFWFFPMSGDSDAGSTDIIRDFNMQGDDTIRIDVLNTAWASKAWSATTVDEDKVFGSGLMLTIEDLVDEVSVVTGQIFLANTASITQADLEFV